MKNKWPLIGFILLLIGTGIRFAHGPGAGLTVIMGALVLLIHGIVFTVRNFKLNPAQSLMHLSIASWTTHSLFRTQFWTYSDIPLGVAILATIGFIAALSRPKTKMRTIFIVSLIYIVISTLVIKLPAYRIYYLFNLNETLYKERREKNYFVWDKYSWFLFHAGKTDEAIKANDVALSIVSKAIDSGDPAAQYAREIIVQHQIAISTNNWNVWTSPEGK